MTVPTHPPDSNRDEWQSKTGFILAAAGSAIGLGNIWRFPYTAGENGGGAFVLIYIGFVVLIGVPVLMAELALGRTSKSNAVGAFRIVSQAGAWPWVGYLGVATGLGILSFYSVVAGWTVTYLWHTLMGTFAGNIEAVSSTALFANITASPVVSVLTAALFLVLTASIVRQGISGGIEKASRYLMPFLLVILVVLLIRSVTLPGAGAGLTYLFSPDFSKLNGAVIISALGQALFSLSIGMGAMITYGAYLKTDTNIPRASAQIAGFDLVIALVAGMIVFPALFAADIPPDAGTGLIFVVLPTLFHAMPAGQIFGFLLYLLLAIAALTSTISLMEVVVTYLTDDRQWSRNRAVAIVGTIAFAFSVPSALAQGGNPFFTELPGLAMDFMTFQSVLWGNYALSLGGLLLCLFVGWKWTAKAAVNTLLLGASGFPGQLLWRFLIRYVCPSAILAILIYLIASGQTVQ